jgi:hypothetical protein
MKHCGVLLELSYIVDDHEKQQSQGYFDFCVAVFVLQENIQHDHVGRTFWVFAGGNLQILNESTT